MRPLEQSFGLESLLTLLLPGLLVGVGIVEMVGPTEDRIRDLLNEARSLELVASLILTGAIMLLGAVVAAVHAAIETWPLDWMTRRLLGISKEEYLDQWHNYLASVAKGRNPYISRLVLFFQFETRLGIAFVFLGLVLWGRSALLGGSTVGIGLFMYAMGAVHHYELGDFRRRHHAEAPIS